MGRQSDEDSAQFYVDTYDASVPDWPGEPDFYRSMAADAARAGGGVLELACGTGRIAVRLGREGLDVVGLDLSARMLERARKKSAGLTNLRWVEGDMRAFRLERTFALVIVPGHAFHNLTTPGDQVACLACVRRHLAPRGRLVVHLDHQDLAWLGALTSGRGGVFETAEEFTHPVSGNRVRTSRAWWCEPADQAVICQTRWEEIDADRVAIDRWLNQPVRLHCVFRFEMEHLLARESFAVEAIYGDFSRRPLTDASSDMIWVARAEPGEDQSASEG